MMDTSHNESSILQQPLLTNSTMQTYETNTPSQTTKRESERNAQIQYNQQQI